MGIVPEEYEKAQKIFKREILKKNPKLFPGIREVIKELSKAYKLVLVSAKDHISKSQIIINFRRKHKLAAEEVVSIGDRDIDFVVGQKAGLKQVILVEYGWGYHKEKTPHQKILVHKPADLLRAIRAIDKKVQRRYYKIV